METGLSSPPPKVRGDRPADKLPSPLLCQIPGRSSAGLRHRGALGRRTRRWVVVRRKAIVVFLEFKQTGRVDIAPRENEAVGGPGAGLAAYWIGCQASRFLVAPGGRVLPWSG